MRILSLLLLLSLTLSTIKAQITIELEETTLTEREVAVGIQVPWEMLYGPDDHLWITEKRGRVLRMEPNSGVSETILNIENLVEADSEPGLLGMALHPDFENVPKVYLVYNYIEGFFNIKERLVSYDWDGTSLTNEVILLDDIPGGNIHNGARLLISRDDKILMTTGDIGNGGLSQDQLNINGKLLRINLDGSIPDDNPDPNSYIYSYGHRNSQGLAYGPHDLLYSSEHGAQSSDEFNIIEEDRNYGWPNVQGACNTNSEINFCNTFNVKEPLAEWSPCVAVNDLCYYDHPAIPEWQGSMLMAVLGGFAKLPRISVLKLSADGQSVESEEQYFKNYGRLRDICINPHTGAIYFATNGNSYPSSGPNKIIEYRNLAFSGVNTNETVVNDAIQIKSNPIIGDQLQFAVDPIFVNGQYHIVAYNGYLALSGSITNNPNMQLNCTALSAGSYFIRVINDGKVSTKSFVVAR